MNILKETEEQICVGDVIFFRETYNKKRGHDSFTGKKTPWGKIIISEKNYHYSGFFRIKHIVKDKENYALVSLGERIAPAELYPEITLEEAKDVLHRWRFKTFEKTVSFKAVGENRTETQLLGWNKDKGIWVNGTTWYGERFNNLEIKLPNVLHTFDKYSSGQYTMDSEEVVIDVRKMSQEAFLPEKLFERIFGIIEKHPNEARISLQTYHTTTGEVHHTGLASYLSCYLKNESFDAYSEYQEELFEELPDDAKEFFAQHQKTVSGIK